MEKLKVNRELGLALKDLIARSRKDYPFEYILNQHAHIKSGTGEKWKGDKWKYLNELSLSEMAQAIYIGYEVEETKEEKLAKLFKSVDDNFDHKNYEVRLLIRDALEIVGVDVPSNYWSDLL